MSLPAAMVSSASVEWPTPPELFAALDAEFGFTLDPCATASSAKCARYFAMDDDGLAQPWAPHTVFCNPPYGPRETGRWVRKAWEESERGAMVVLLIPARVDTAWWHEYCSRGEVRFLRGRVRFVGSETGAPFPSAVVVFRPRPVAVTAYVRPTHGACYICGGPKRPRADARYCSSACRQRAYRRRLVGPRHA